MINKKRLGFFIVLIFLILHLFMMKDYGLSWDFHYHFYAGRYHLGLPVPSVTDPSPVPFSPPDPRLTTEDPFGPFTQIIPSLSNYLFYEKLHFLSSADSYNLPMVIIGVAGIGLLFVFLLESFGVYAAVMGSLFLALFPVYFGYLHNNMKDVPNAFAFALSLYLFQRLVKNRKSKDLFWAVVSFSIAFNFKINSVIIPVICFLWFVLSNLSQIKKPLQFIKKNLLIITYFLLAPLGAIFFWWPFWRNPLGKLMELPFFYSHNTLNIPILFMGKILLSGVYVPWYYPYVYIAINTPLPILIPFVLGFFICLFNLRKQRGIYSLLLLWFVIPLVRYLNPKMGAIDGMRHFLEVVYPMAAIAVVGWLEISKRIIFKYVASVLIIGLLGYNIIHFYPYQTSYFNSLTGGIKGAWGQFDIDFWGTSQKEAMEWLNKNAPKGSYVYIAMAQSTAAVYAREDLRQKLNQKPVEESDYVMVLNREAFFTVSGLKNFIEKKLKEDKAVYKRVIDGVPLVWVLKK